MANDFTYDSPINLEFDTPNANLKGRIQIYNLWSEKTEPSDQEIAAGYAKDKLDTTDTLHFRWVVQFKSNGQIAIGQRQVTYTINVSTVTDAGDYGGETFYDNGQTHDWCVPEGWTDWYTLRWGSGGGTAGFLEPLQNNTIKVSINIQSSESSFNVSTKTMTFTVKPTSTQVGQSSIITMRDNGDNTCYIEGKIGANGKNGNTASQCHIYITDDGSDPHSNNIGTNAAGGWGVTLRKPNGDFQFGAGNIGQWSIGVTRSCLIKVRPYTTSDKWGRWKNVHHPDNKVSECWVCYKALPKWSNANLPTFTCDDVTPKIDSHFTAQWPSAESSDGGRTPIFEYRLRLYHRKPGQAETLAMTITKQPTDTQHSFDMLTDNLDLKDGDQLYFTVEPSVKSWIRNGWIRDYGEMRTSNVLTISERGFCHYKTASGWKPGITYVKTSANKWSRALDMFVKGCPSTIIPSDCNRGIEWKIEPVVDKVSKTIFTKLYIRRVDTGVTQANIVDMTVSLNLENLINKEKVTFNKKLSVTVPAYSTTWTLVYDNTTTPQKDSLIEYHYDEDTVPEYRYTLRVRSTTNSKCLGGVYSTITTAKMPRWLNSKEPETGGIV